MESNKRLGILQSLISIFSARQRIVEMVVQDSKVRWRQRNKTKGDPWKYVSHLNAIQWIVKVLGSCSLTFWGALTTATSCNATRTTMLIICPVNSEATQAINLMSGQYQFLFSSAKFHFLTDCGYIVHTDISAYHFEYLLSPQHTYWWRHTPNQKV